MFTKEQIKILKGDNTIGLFKEVVGNRIVFLTCNMEDEGTYTIEALDWGEFKTVLRYGEDYIKESVYSDFNNLLYGREKSRYKNKMW